MPVPTLITELSATAGSNGPAGGDTPADGDNHIRALAAFIASIRDNTGNGWVSPYATPASVTAAIAALPTLASGTYTPTITETFGFASAAVTAHVYKRIGAAVHVVGIATGNSSSSGTSAFRITLPVSSNLAANSDCVGTATANSGSVYNVGVVVSDTTNDAASISFNQTSGSAAWAVYYSFMYRIS